jgi:hypothetical protein
MWQGELEKLLADSLTWLNMVKGCMLPALAGAQSGLHIAAGLRGSISGRSIHLWKHFGLPIDFFITF